jgi:hypothetical protein
MPEGYLAPKLLAWTWAEVRLTESRNYWVSTVTSRGTPHTRPVWAVWLDDLLFFSSGSRIRTHIEENPDVSVNLESGDECVIIEGTATPLLDEALARRVAAVYNEKYHWDMAPTAGEFFELRPRAIFGWLCDGSGRDGGALFSQSATRWRFD